MNCPTCERIEHSNGQPIILGHPEEVPYMCPKHLEWIKNWHDEQVSKDLITPWEGLNTMNYKDYIITQGGKEVGIPFKDIEEYLLPPAKYKEFEHFMRGQTCGLVGGMSICYTGDFERFLKGLPVID